MRSQRANGRAQQVQQQQQARQGRQLRPQVPRAPDSPDGRDDLPPVPRASPAQVAALREAQQKGEKVTILDASTNPDGTAPDGERTVRDANGDLQMTGAPDGVLLGTYLEDEELAKTGGDPVLRFRVAKNTERPVATGAVGVRSTLRAGKVVDSLNYDLDLLVRQGVELVPLDGPLSG